MINVKCSSCGNVIRVKDHHAGKTFRCPVDGCPGVIQVPKIKQTPTQPKTSDELFPAEDDSKSSSTKKRVAIISVSSVGVLLFIGLMWFAFGGDNEQTIGKTNALTNREASNGKTQSVASTENNANTNDPITYFSADGGEAYRTIVWSTSNKPFPLDSFEKVIPHSTNACAYCERSWHFG
jgi:hypothetical protein